MLFGSDLSISPGALRTPGGPQKGLIGNSRFNRQYKAIIRDFSIFSTFFSEILRVIFKVFWSKSKVLGQIGRSGRSWDSFPPILVQIRRRDAS